MIVNADLVLSSSIDSNPYLHFVQTSETVSSSRSISSDEGSITTRPVDGQGEAGVGLQFRECAEGIAVVALVQGGPAHLSGAIYVGDVIKRIDDVELAGKDIRQAVLLLSGNRGSK
ncbi:hypothetical protein GUITHDRAFT_106122 [Guillardia theta CCMP2712]|uniref:PDZ domain-containing protein n=1 Tax=Guillardia theta (strain CCMP2712) TaxID=905079 RepID=L1JHN7_GUITC|nr:hypothetical protein GUITHDRAFT_106122 [Guillardia theta CCMP2712]EKX48038.1 hypothetical protein GUITHDRAFT_106122 [Guillardia theta CCMP2712]|eukprot:XP_005835018.1 hypothetical protein GUITHDRAFT_106122 [Guillardia theta CCMP2712]